MPSLPRPFARSLSLRLLLIFVVTGALCLLVLVSLSSQGLSGQWRRSIQPHLSQYVGYVQRDLGNPPNATRADAIAGAVPIDIALFRQGEFVHATDGRRPAIERQRFRPLPNRLTERVGAVGDVAISNDRRQPVLRVALDDWTVYYRLDARHRGGNPFDELIVAILALGAILFAAWWLIRRQLRPIGTIQAAVAQMSDGDLDARAALAGRDDLAHLGDSIDALAARLSALLDSKRELLLAVSHELKSPLARLRVALELAPLGSHRQRLVDEVTDMGALIDDLLESERLQDRHVVLQRRPVDLVPLLQVLIDTLRREHDQAMTTLTLTSADNDLVVHGDEIRLALLFRNLLRNALLHGRDERGQADVRIDARRAGDDVCVTVQDRGPGIAPADRVRVLEPFERLDVSRSRRTGGSGLGLSLAAGIARAHDGELTLEAAEPYGLVARVRLPAR